MHALGQLSYLDVEVLGAILGLTRANRDLVTGNRAPALAIEDTKEGAR